MKKIVFILLMALFVPMCTVYAQDCSDRIQSAGKLYDNYKKTKNKKQLDEARKQLQNIINNSSNPENCRKSASSMLKTFRPIAFVKKSNVEVAPIVVRIDTVVETHVNIDSVVNVVVHHDSLKVRRERGGGPGLCLEEGLRVRHRPISDHRRLRAGAQDGRRRHLRV